jgi:hypothetical protein
MIKDLSSKNFYKVFKENQEKHKIEKHYVSLQLAKQLKETGWKKETELVILRRINGKRHFEECPGTKDFLIADFERWLAELDIYLDYPWKLF